MDKDKFRKYSNAKKDTIKRAKTVDKAAEKQLKKEEEKAPFTELFGRKQKGHHTLDDKVLAVLVLDMTQEHTDDIPEPSYQWEMVSELLGVSQITLKKWWGQKSRIMNLADGITSKLSKLLVLKMSEETMRLLESFGETDYKNESLRDRTSLFNNLLNKMSDVMDRMSDIQNKNVSNARFTAVLPKDIGE